MDQSNIPVPGKGQAVASLVLGIFSLVFACISPCFWPLGILALILGITGLVLAAVAKKQGFSGGMCTAGFVLSLLGVIFGAIVFVGCVACIGCTACTGSGLTELFDELSREL